jgi:tetratricopeptide (TPR) repeat protein/tRNA A-37 threonylcarbamoyl transferase component Bud32
VVSSCPSDAALEAFARGVGDPGSRAELAAHIRECANCQARYLPMALHNSALTQTNFDSPAARNRKHSRDTPVQRKLVTDAPGLEDTHVSGERQAVDLTGSSIQKGEALDRYVILDRLGAGGMGEVFSAWDPVLDRKVAVKVLRPDFEGSELGEELKERLLHEAQALAKLSHPNVVTVHDVGLAGDRVYLAMEFAEGRTLKQWLEQKPKPSWQSTLEVFLAAGEGLVAAHTQGITHRDFKPDNVVVGSEGRVRVMDFGLAHGRTEKTDTPGGTRRSITGPGAMLGTPAYMSPEALHGQATDFRSDEFGFCVALFEAFYGFRPFEGATPGALVVEIEANRVRPAPRDTKVPRRIHQLLLKGLRSNPAERFQTMRALLIQLGRRRSAQEQRLAVGSVAALAVLAAALTLLATYRARTRCADVDQRLRSVWDPSVKKTVRQAFEATQKPWAGAAWRDVEARLDEYSAQWLTMRRAACEGSLERNDEQLGQEIVCLSRRLSDLEATTELFAHADAEVVERAVNTASALAPLSTCRQTAAIVRRTPEGDTTRAQLSAVKTRLDAGKYADALALASELAAKASAANDLSTYAEARLWMAIGKMRTGDAKAADTLVEESILAAETAQDDELQARGWVERIGFAAMNAAPADADRWIRFARAALDRIGKPAELEASFANNQGVIAYFRGNYPAAIEAHQRALSLRRELLGEKHPLVARSHSNLGIAFKQLGRLDDARAQYEQALTIEEQVLDASHPQVAETLNNLGNVLQAQGSPTGARRALERSLRIKEAAFGKDSLPVAVTLTNLGVLLLDLQDLPEAEASLQRALEIKEQRTGADSLTVAITLTNLAHARRGTRHWAESIALDERALAIRKTRQGEQHLDLAYNLTGLGEAKLQTKDVAGAKLVLEQALALRRERGVDRATTAYWLARALAGTKDTRTRSLLEEAVADLPASSALKHEAQTVLTR